MTDKQRKRLLKLVDEREEHVTNCFKNLRTFLQKEHPEIVDGMMIYYYTFDGIRHHISNFKFGDALGDYDWDVLVRNFGYSTFDSEEKCIESLDENTVDHDEQVLEQVLKDGRFNQPDRYRTDIRYDLKKAAKLYHARMTSNPENPDN